ncbi:hypothetical protein G7046_g2872 [Stylonectria norvegica]|nr:hypothetical protein G7046_g2872 [Stylonectria norvegica]
MTQIYRLAVLECDTPFPAVAAARGSYGDIFEDLLTKGLGGLGSEGSNIQLNVTKWDVVTAQSYPNIDEVDGILLTGSSTLAAEYAAFADDPWIKVLVEFVKDTITKTSKSVVGFCFGHQIIGRAIGAKVDVSPGGWEVSVEKVNFNEEGQKLLGASSVDIQQMHRDAVLDVPEGFVSLGSSPKCTIQGLYKPGHVLTLQGHPEFDDFVISEVLESRHKAKIFDDEMFEDGMARVHRPHDGAMLAIGIWKFLLASKFKTV